MIPGDATIIINGEPRALRLTLGALAEIEETVGEGDLETLRERLKAPRVGDLLLILHALIAGGGQRLALDLLKASDVDFKEAAKAIGEAFKALGSGSGDGPWAMGNGKARAPNAAPQSPRHAPRRANAHSPLPIASADASPKKPRASGSPGGRGSAPESSR